VRDGDLVGALERLAAAFGKVRHRVVALDRELALVEVEVLHVALALVLGRHKRRDDVGLRLSNGLRGDGGGVGEGQREAGEGERGAAVHGGDSKGPCGPNSRRRSDFERPAVSVTDARELRAARSPFQLSAALANERSAPRRGALTVLRRWG